MPKSFHAKIMVTSVFKSGRTNHHALKTIQYLYSHSSTFFFNNIQNLTKSVIITADLLLST